MTDLKKFRDLGISQTMLDALHKKGFEEPSSIQAKTIPFLLANKKDLIGKAQTGTGKTAAFGIPLIENIVPNKGYVQALILAPTRELAIQVTEELSSFATNFETKIISIYGGQPIERQISRLQRGVDIVVGTPGRIIDHLNRKTLNISKLSYIVLDEADEMLNMGFIEDIEEILKMAPKQRRTVLFSATMPAHIEKLAKNYMTEYEIISVISEKSAKKNIEQIYFEVAQSDKFEALYRIIDVEESFYGMIFCRTKLDVDEVASKLTNRGLRSDAIHGDLSQGQREKVLNKFRDKKINILVATDVAARGIDVDNLTHVINYSLPQDPESYVHRIGRTGRAGKSGTAITLITPSEYRKLISIQKMANATITKQKIPDVQDIIVNKKQRISSLISKTLEDADFGDFEKLANEIVTNNDPKKSIAALLKIAFKNELKESNYNEIRDPSKKRDYNSYDERGMGGGYRNPIGSEGKRNYVDRKGTARLFIAKGRSNNMDARKLVEFIQSETGVDQRRIDDVSVFDNFSFFAVPFEDAEKVLRSFNNKANGKKSLVTRAKKR